MTDQKQDFITEQWKLFLSHIRSSIDVLYASCAKKSYEYSIPSVESTTDLPASSTRVYNRMATTVSRSSYKKCAYIRKIPRTAYIEIPYQSIVHECTT